MNEIPPRDYSSTSRGFESSILPDLYNQRHCISLYSTFHQELYKYVHFPVHCLRKLSQAMFLSELRSCSGLNNHQATREPSALSPSNPHQNRRHNNLNCDLGMLRVLIQAPKPAPIAIHLWWYVGRISSLIALE